MHFWFFPHPLPALCTSLSICCAVMRFLREASLGRMNRCSENHLCCKDLFSIIREVCKQLYRISDLEKREMDFQGGADGNPFPGHVHGFCWRGKSRTSWAMIIHGLPALKDLGFWSDFYLLKCSRSIMSAGYRRVNCRNENGKQFPPLPCWPPETFWVHIIICYSVAWFLKG